MRPLILALSPGAVDDRRVVLVERDALGAAEVADRDVLELEPELLGDDLTAGEHGDVLEHLLAAVAEARRLGGGAVERATELVDDERREGLALDVLGDDEERLLAARNRLEHREQILHVRDLLLADEDVRVLQHGFHALGIRHEVRAEVAAVELHALDHFEGRLGRLALFDGDDAFLADLLHRLGELVPISLSPLALMVPTCSISFGSFVCFAIFFSSSTTASTALSMPRLISIGLWPAATSLLPSR